MEHMASHSLTRLYIVVSKSVTEETLEYLFGVFEGLEYVDLKRDHATGLSRVSPVIALQAPLAHLGKPSSAVGAAVLQLIMELYTSSAL